MVRAATIVGTIVALALLGYMLNSINLTPTSALSSVPEQSLENLASTKNVLNLEANYIWYNRILDTLFQAVVLLTALLSVLVLFRKEAGHGG